MQRRTGLLGLAAMAGAPWLAFPARAQSLPPATVAVPGPRNSVSLPLELAVKLGLDREAGLPLRLSFVGGGGVAIQELRAGNAEFAVCGLPALVHANLTGGARLVAIAAIDGLPLYTLVVRADLRGTVRGIRDLAGRTVGVHSDTLQARTTSHQLFDYLMRRNGLDPARVKVLAAGQSWETQSSMLISRAIDASMCDEPFATRMEAEGLAYKIFSTGNPADVAGVPGTGFLRAVLATRQRLADAKPERTRRAVRTVETALAWIGTHSAEGFADALDMQGAERASALAVAVAYPRRYSPDGRFSAGQIAETELFFRATNLDLRGLDSLRIDDMVVDRWVGRRP